MLFLLKYISRFCFRLFGWKISGTPVPTDKCIVVSAFHTSNWDFILCMGAQFYSGRKVSWLGKQSLFKPPWGGFFRVLGGIPVDRSQKHGMVGTLAEHIKMERQIILAIFPGGTRKRTSQWKKGFYQIALASEVPLQAMGLDFATKTIVFGELFWPSGNLEKDFKYLREFFAPITAQHPEKADKNFTYAE
jgi:1-acyl-sn-glycerol-3-phosphate acyltransferase